MEWLQNFDWPSIIISSIGLVLGFLSLTVNLAMVIAVIIYAWLTYRIAKSSEDNVKISKTNTDINRSHLVGFYPSFSFSEKSINSFIGSFASGSRGGYHFNFHIYNFKPIPGLVKFDFDFLRLTSSGELVETGIKVFSNDIMYSDYCDDSQRYYLIQPNGSAVISPQIRDNSFEEWICSGYPSVKDKIKTKIVSLDHITQEIYVQTQTAGKPQPSNLFVKLIMTAKPYTIAEVYNPYIFKEIFYLRFDGSNPTQISIINDPMRRSEF